MKIGIAVTTTPNREHVFNEWYKHYAKTTPNIPLYIHNDINYQGVVYSKNKCLAALEEYDYIFLLDDDCFPIVQNWPLLYIKSCLNHACWNYDRQCVTIKNIIEHSIQMNAYDEYNKPNGCMLFFTKKCIGIVGGWDIDFNGYGYEHVNLSDRIFNNGLTPARYIDIPDSKGLFKMADCQSSFLISDRAQIPNNFKLYQQKYLSKEFKPFK